MSDHGNRVQFIADRGDARLRLDQAVVRRVGRDLKLSRTQAQQWIDAGFVELDGRPARRASQPLADGTVVVVTVPDDTMRRRPPAPEELALDIVYEDEHLLAVNKPPAVVVHPTYKHPSKTVLNAVLWRLRDRPSAHPGVLTRLDKDTSGLVLVALSPSVHAAVQADARAGRVAKRYLAIVEGSPRPRGGVIQLPLGRDPADRRRVTVRADGAASETRYDTLAGDGRRSLVSCELITGRTHQIRVHLAASGWPIVGDRVYGTADDRIERQALHAWRLTLPHPVTGVRLQFEAPVPGDFAEVLSSQLSVSNSLRSSATDN
jgi:23S rRNA pseudouridine1911/1915/1917 synthase